MAETDWLYPTSTGDPVDQWTNGANLKADDSAEATEDTVEEVEDTDTYNFQAHIPEGAKINGIEVKVEASVANWAETGPATATLGVRLSFDGATSYNGQLTYGFVGSGLFSPALPEVYVFGSPTTSWAWPPDDIYPTRENMQNLTFRARIEFVSSSDGSIDFGANGGVDFVAIKVHYTPHTITIDGACVGVEDQIITVG